MIRLALHGGAGDLAADTTDTREYRAALRRIASEGRDMLQAGARPLTSLQYLLELQRDWARGETYELTTGIAKKFGGAYGLGIIYAKSMFGAHEG